MLEELAAAWMTVGVGLSVHTMSCYPLARFGSDAQRDEWLPAMLGGDLLGAYALSEPQAGSDAAALSARAVRDGGRLPGQRDEGVDHARRAGGLLHGAWSAPATRAAAGSAAC